jgi:hypothetical protein
MRMGARMPGSIGGTGFPASPLADIHLHMIDREKVLAVLRKRFPAATPGQYAAAANAIVGLGDDWEDVTGHEPEFGYHFSVQCSEICYIADEAAQGAQFCLFKRRSGDA